MPTPSPATQARDAIVRANEYSKLRFAFSPDEFLLYARMRKVEDALKAFERDRSDANLRELTKQNLYLRRRLDRITKKG